MFCQHPTSSHFVDSSVGFGPAHPRREHSQIAWTSASLNVRLKGRPRTSFENNKEEGKETQEEEVWDLPIVVGGERGLAELVVTRHERKRRGWPHPAGKVEEKEWVDLSMCVHMCVFLCVFVCM